LWIDDLIREFQCVGGWKAFVVQFEERKTRDYERNRIMSNGLEPGLECRLERLQHLNKMLVCTLKTLNARQEVLEPDGRWPD
jgi:hypothetical protein